MRAGNRETGLQESLPLIHVLRQIGRTVTQHVSLDEIESPSQTRSNHRKVLVFIGAAGDHLLVADLLFRRVIGDVVRALPDQQRLAEDLKLKPRLTQIIGDAVGVYDAGDPVGLAVVRVGRRTGSKVMLATAAEVNDAL